MHMLYQSPKITNRKHTNPCMHIQTNRLSTEKTGMKANELSYQSAKTHTCTSAHIYFAWKGCIVIEVTQWLTFDHTPHPPIPP